jgi:hypothetical protein
MSERNWYPPKRCRSCRAPIWWRMTAAGKRQPMDYDLERAEPLETSHYATCPQRDQWRRPKSSA